jgi:hypothetical protein
MVWMLWGSQKRAVCAKTNLKKKKWPNLTLSIKFLLLARKDGKVVDQVTGQVVSGTQVQAGHIYPHSKCANLPKFGLEVEFSMHPKNGLLMLKGISTMYPPVSS